MQTKEDWLYQLQDEFDRWENLLAGLDEAYIVARQLPSGLSIKDVIAHLWAWQQLSIARLEAAIDDRAPTYQLHPNALDPDVEENLERINAWIHESNENRSWEDVHVDWQKGYQLLLDLAAAIPAQDLMAEGKYAWLHGQPLVAVLDGSYDHHHNEHYGPLVQWLRENDKLG
jgi:hypothetical protein